MLPRRSDPDAAAGDSVISRPVVRTVAGLMVLAACDRATDEGAQGSIVGSARTPVLVAYGAASTQATFERVVDVQDDGSFVVPLAALAVIAFEDLDGDRAFSPGAPRLPSFPCSR